LRLISINIQTYLEDDNPGRDLETHWITGFMDFINLFDKWKGKLQRFTLK